MAQLEIGIIIIDIVVGLYIFRTNSKKNSLYLAERVVIMRNLDYCKMMSKDNIHKDPSNSL